MTNSGWTAAFVGVVLLIAGGLAHYPELIGFGAACVLALSSAGLAMLIRSEIAVSRQVRPSRVTEGGAAQAVLTVTNAGRYRSLPVVAIERFDGRTFAIRTPSLAPGASHQVSYSLATSRRGVFSVGPLTIARSDPLGLVRIEQSEVSATTLWVHPKTRRLNTVPAGWSHGTDGPTVETSPSGGIAFHSLRKYQTGNDLRLVHWKASARTGALMVRNNVVPHEPQLIALLDTTADRYSGDGFEHAVRIMASLCVSACDGRVPVLLRTSGGDTASAQHPGRGRAALLDLLASASLSTGDTGLVPLAALAARNGGLSLMVVTGRPPPGALDAISVLRRRFEIVTVIQVGDAARSGAHVPGAFVISVASSSEFESAWNKPALR